MPIRGLFFVLPLVWCFIAFADEKVGTLSVEDLRLRPTIVSNEDDGGNFNISESTLLLKWMHDKRLSAYLGVGSTLMRNLPIYYAAPNEDKLGFYEGYAQYEDVYGRVRFGLIPLNFGYDGILKFGERHFKFTLPVSQRVIGRSDLGFSFFTENNGYYTELIVHNGEVDTVSDGRLWTTANWGWTNNRNMRAQLSLQTGYVKGEASAGSTQEVGGITNGETARWRNGLFFINWYPRDWSVVLQLGGGEAEQGEYQGRYSNSLFEISRFTSKNFGLGLRYEDLDPNRKINGDVMSEASLVFIFKNDDSTSQVHFLGTKVIEEKNEQSNDELRLVWVVAPYAR